MKYILISVALLLTVGGAVIYRNATSSSTDKQVLAANSAALANDTRIYDVRTEEEKAGGAERLPQMPILWSRADNCHRQMHVSQSTSYRLPVRVRIEVSSRRGLSDCRRCVQLVDTRCRTLLRRRECDKTILRAEEG